MLQIKVLKILWGVGLCVRKRTALYRGRVNDSAESKPTQGSTDPHVEMLVGGIFDRKVTQCPIAHWVPDLLVPALIRPPPCHIFAFRTPALPSKNYEGQQPLLHLLLLFVFRLLFPHSQMSFILHAHLSLHLSSNTLNSLPFSTVIEEPPQTTSSLSA